jgi:hypothetical protein
MTKHLHRILPETQQTLDWNVIAGYVYQVYASDALAQQYFKLPDKWDKAMTNSS